MCIRHTRWFVSISCYAIRYAKQPSNLSEMDNRVISGLTGCEAYIDDLVLHSDSWDSLMQVQRALFDRLRAARLTVNLAQSEFCQATVHYLGYVVGQGQIKPVTAKIDDILGYPAPRDKRSMMRFCVNLSSLINPLTNLLGKNVKFILSKECNEAFERVKRLLMTSPVLITANYEMQFCLYADASDIGIGGVSQLCSDDVDHPILVELMRNKERETKQTCPWLCGVNVQMWGWEVL